MKQTRNGGAHSSHRTYRPRQHHPGHHRPRPSHRAPPQRRWTAAGATGAALAPRARWALGLGALLLVLVGGLLGTFHAPPVHLEIRPRPEGLDPVTYNNAVRIVDIAKGFVETQREVAAFRAELTPR